MQTKFASAERAGTGKLNQQFNYFRNESLTKLFIDSVPDAVLVLNEFRQIVFGNKASVNLLKINSIEEVLGKRPGEALNCIYSDIEEGGCGTSIFCKECGAAKAIIKALAGWESTQECHILQKGDDSALDLLVMTTPLVYKDEIFTIFAIQDISSQKRRRALERIFFHDILNTVGGLKGFAEIIKDADEEEIPEFIEILSQLSEKLVDEIQAQRELNAAENDELIINPTFISNLDIIKEVKYLYTYHGISDGKSIYISEESEEVKIFTDATILRRIISNMLKNALEASVMGQKVTIGSRKTDEEVEFWVHNETYMPENVQLQVFKRSFSTKGEGRGLGTYSIKLLSGKYLNGKVSFLSQKGTGTVFRVSIPLEIHKNWIN